VKTPEQQTPKQAMAERFARETTKHEMTILHDDGLYRHLRFRSPDNSFYWFELVAWPGKLSVGGDVDGFTFSRTEDMFGFFRQSSYKGGINASYWAEKVVASRNDVKAYSMDLFNEQVAAELKDAEEDYPGIAKAWDEKNTGFFAEYNTEYEDGAFAALHEFSFLPENATGEPFTFYDTSDWDLTDYSWNFLWCCNAIVWGIRQYDAAKQDGGQSHA
jgi:hypothetical protein